MGGRRIVHDGYASEKGAVCQTMERMDGWITRRGGRGE